MRSAKEPDGIKLVLMGQVAEAFLISAGTERGRAYWKRGAALADTASQRRLRGYAGRFC